MNILTGIFVEKAMKLAPPDANVLALKKRRQEEITVRQAMRFLQNEVLYMMDPIMAC